MQCPECTHENPPASNFCVFCGKTLHIEQAQCTGCGKMVKAEYKFCPHCGSAVSRGPIARFCAFCGTKLTMQEGGKPFCSRCGGAQAGASAGAPAGAPAVAPALVAMSCKVCGKPSGPAGFCEAHGKTHLQCPGCSAIVEKAAGFCASCRSLINLPGDFTLVPDDYEFAADREAMKKLRSLKPLTALIESLSKKFGKSFIESRFIGGGIKVTDAQFPRIQNLAVTAATVLGLKRLPELYISGDIPWSSDTYGTETDAFIVLGTYLTRVLSDIELLFILGHELAHVRSGHAMYRTVAQVFAGYQGPKGVMGGGILGLIDVQKLLSASIELPLLMWMRESEVTGDCAGLLVVKDRLIARKVLLLQALRSPDLYKEINQEAYLRQQEEAENQIGKLSEFLSQGTPYVSRRIKFVEEYAGSTAYNGATERMSGSKDLFPVLNKIASMGAHPPPAGQQPAPVKPEHRAVPSPAPSSGIPGKEPRKPADARADDRLRGLCPHCSSPFSVARSKLPTTGDIMLRCKECKKTFPPKVKGTATPVAAQAFPREEEDYS
jgi:predicted Zn finger-like uncharacterized protein